MVESEHMIVRLINRLTEKRALLLRRVNSNESLAKDLPNETISLIFIFACQQPDFLNPGPYSPKGQHQSSSISPFVLAAVSSHWNHIVHSTPQLWTSVRADVSSYNVDKTVCRLRYYIHKCRALGITIDLDFWSQMTFYNALPERRRRAPSSYNVQCLDPVRNLIFHEFPENIKALRLVSPPPEWIDISLQAHKKRFTQLEAIQLSWGNTEFMRISLDNSLNLSGIPKLRHVALYDVPNLNTYRIYEAPPKIKWAPSTITELDLYQIDYYACMDLLFQCKNLRSFTMTNPVCGPVAKNPPHTIVLPKKNLKHLTHFEWTFPFAHSEYTEHYENGNELPPLGIAPMLRTIIIQNAFSLDPDEEEHPIFHTYPISGLNIFLDNIPQSCESITLCTNTHAYNLVSPEDAKDVRRIWECIRGIPRTISEVKLMTDSILLLPLMTELGNVLQSGQISSLLIAFPRGYTAGERRERIFSTRNVLMGWEFYKAVSKALKFRFEYETDCVNIEWDTVVQNELKKLVENGLDLEILEDGKLVDWIRL